MVPGMQAQGMAQVRVHQEQGNDMKLTDEQLVLLEDAAWDADMDFRKDYSGRGMYGKTCVGITGGLPGLVKFVQLITEQGENLAEDIQGIASDSMGLNTIYYFPGMET